jgi:hypothetical protein
MFRGYESAWDSPIDKPVMSWMDWKDVLRRDDISIMSEDDEEFDAEEFISIVEKVPENLRRRQYDAVVADEIKYGRRRFIGRDWLDSDLFSFHNEEFS